MDLKLLPSLASPRKIPCWTRSFRAQPTPLGEGEGGPAPLFRSRSRKLEDPREAMSCQATHSRAAKRSSAAADHRDLICDPVAECLHSWSRMPTSTSCSTTKPCTTSAFGRSSRRHLLEEVRRLPLTCRLGTRGEDELQDEAGIRDASNGAHAEKCADPVEVERLFT